MLNPRSVVHVLDGLVTLASGRFEPVTVKNADFAAVVADQLSLAQGAGGLGNANPPHSQYVAKKILV